MTLSLAAKKWLLNERNRQKHEDDKIKTSLALRKSTAVSNDKEISNYSMPNQYISNSLHNKYMNLLHLPEKYHMSILDGCADTCLLGQG
jgi:hypothetical protein